MRLAHGGAGSAASVVLHLVAGEGAVPELVFAAITVALIEWAKAGDTRPLKPTFRSAKTLPNRQLNLLETLRKRDGHGRNVVRVVTFCKDVGTVEAAVDGYAQQVIAGNNARDVNPLAIEVGAIRKGKGVSQR
jgi:hypothetical protein